MAVPKQHRSKSRQGQRRMHQFISEPALCACSHCKKNIAPHTMCPFCGYYKGKEVLNVLKKTEKKAKKAEHAHA